MKKGQSSKKKATKAMYKTINGMQIEPCVYKGSAVGHGTYVAAKFEDGKLVIDKRGRPVPYRMLVKS